MCTALAASIGTGNIAGVSGAIAIGGPGAVFWMWVSALLGMCTKFSEVTLALKYRKRNKEGDWVGGPMYYITNGLGKNWKWLASVFAVFGALAAFGIGNMTQINTIAGTINTAIAGFIPTTESQQTMIAWIVAIICALICAIVLLGGIQRLADVDHPVKQGIYGVFEVFMDTIVVCTMTALVVLLGVGVQNIEYGTDIGANLTIMGFESVFGGGIPGIAVAVCLTLFALSTVLTWALYGSRCVEYLFGYKASKVYQVIFCLFACIAGTVELSLAWAIADTLNGLMAIPNLIALALLSPVVIKLSKEYFAEVKANK